jgi:hypothetical protein
MKRVFLLAFVLAAGSAFGQALPNFPIERHCQAAGDGYDYCVQRTQEIYGRLQEQWEAIPRDVRGRCLKWLKTSSKPDSYYQLEGCVFGSAEPTPPPVEYAPPPPPYDYAPPPPPPVVLFGPRWHYYRY